MFCIVFGQFPCFLFLFGLFVSVAGLVFRGHFTSENRRAGRDFLIFGNFFFGKFFFLATKTFLQRFSKARGASESEASRKLLLV